MRCKERQEKLSDLNREQTEHDIENDNTHDEWGRLKIESFTKNTWYSHNSQGLLEG